MLQKAKSKGKKTKPASRFGTTGVVLATAVAALVIISAYQFTIIGSLSGQNAKLANQVSALSNQIATLSNQTRSSTQKVTYPKYDIQSPLPQPPMSLSGYPVVTANGAFGSRLTNINAQLNASELAVINGAPNSYFEIAGEMLLNGTLNNTVAASPTKVNQFIVNGKPSVIYLGSITCVWCGENRWAMALALGRFGSFSHLFKGYSSLGDGDVPTLYWRPDVYGNDSVNVGSFYNSSYINFLPMEDTAPITGGFYLEPLATTQGEINATGIPAYMSAFQYILQLNSFQGTPYTIWGNYVVGGADAIDFGNGAPQGSALPITSMTHEQILAQLANPSSQFAWTEYAGADLYVALACSSINNAAPICTLPVIPKIEGHLGV